MIIVALSAFGLLAGGCATAGHAADDAAGDGLPWGETFAATSITEDGHERPLVPGIPIELTFEDGRLLANGGCSQMTGPVSDDQGRLVVADLGSFSLGCGPELNAQKDLLAAFLKEQPLWSYEAGELWLRTEAVSLRLAAVDP